MKKRSTVSSVCLLACEKSERNWHPPSIEKPKIMRTPEIIAAVAESVGEASSTSIHRRPQQFNISKTSLRRVLHKDLDMTPHKVQLVQELIPIDHPMRFRFAKWACDLLKEDANFGKKKSPFTDEAHFDPGEYVHKQAKLLHLGRRKPARIH